MPNNTNNLRLVTSTGECAETSTSKTWFLTGVTGFIGRQFLRKLIYDTNDRVVAIVRERPGLSARERGERLIKALFGEADRRDLAKRISIVAGDVVDEKLGLPDSDWKRFAKSTDYVVHMAACTRFDASLSDARRHNVHATNNVMTFARTAAKSDFSAYVHLSTAYVAGDTTGLVGPDYLNIKDRFRNAYEQSKAEAEANVRAAKGELPVIIFRPSIVVGDSQTGEAIGLSTVYWGIKSYLQGQRQFYANENASLDLVPVDYVANAMMSIIQKNDALGNCYLLAGGANKSIALKEFTTLLCEHFSMPLPIFFPPAKLHKLRAMRLVAKLSRKHRMFLEQAHCYLPYFSQNPIFDCSKTESILADSGIRVPHLSEYVDTLLNYCIEQGWCAQSRLSATA